MAPKRSAPKDAVSPRAAKRNKDADQVAPIVSALREWGLMPETIPTRVLEMLVSAAPSAFSGTSSERHEIQTLIIRQIEEVLQKAAGMAQDRVTQVTDAASAAIAAVKEAENKVESAKKAAEEACKVEEEQQTQISELASAIKVAERELKTAEMAEKKHLKDRVKFEKPKEKYQSTLDNGLKALLEGCEEPKKVMAKFCKEMENYGCETSLIASAPSVLMKKAADRKSFDGSVIDSLGKCLTDRIAQADAEIVAFDESGKEVVEIAAKMRASTEEKKVEKETAEKKLAELSEMHEASKSALDAAEENLQTLVSSHLEETKVVERESAALKSFNDALSLVEELVSRSGEVAAAPAAGA